MKVAIDRDGCISCTQCWMLCPHIFEENPEDGKSMIVEMFRSDSDIG
ncbi:MAG: ferredoxin, partial [Methanobacteriota archaeon]